MLSRRTFLGLVSAAPTLFIPRLSRAATPAFGSAKHLLILFLKGGLRSHSTFNAVGSLEHNPFGRQAAEGIEWSLGGAARHEPIQSSAGMIDGFLSVARELAVIPCVDHTPGEAPIVDHLPAVQRIGTGATSGAPGLLTRIGRYHPSLVGGWPTDRAPPVEIGPSSFGDGPGEDRRFRPLSIADARTPLISSPTLGQGPGIAARRALEQTFSSRLGLHQARVSAFLEAKDSAAHFARLLADPRLSLRADPNASGASGLSNQQLLEIFDGAPAFVGPRLGPEVALAVRFLELGSPAVVVTKANYDFHDREAELYGPVTADLGRQLAGLRYVLRQMPHPSGGNYWQHTVVSVVSEFSRNNGSPSTGFNSGLGSDHTKEKPDAMRNQAVALMGGPIITKGKLIGATDQDMHPIGPVFSSRSLLATFLDVLGLDPAPFWPDPPIGELFR
ncbi:MAG: DUF1501 domain-containing protein [Myxococcota bacterium]